MPKEINFSGFVGDELTVDLVKNSLAAVEGEDIKVFLNSPGGLVFEGMEIYNVISRFPGKKEVVIGGLVASIATYITAAFDKVVATESSAFMIHNASDFAIGDYKELKKAADRAEKANEQVANILAKRSGKTVDEIKTLMDAETWYYGQEIVDAGFADELIESKDSAQPRDIAIAQAQNIIKLKTAAYYKKKETEFDSGNGVENKKDSEGSMGKKEMLTGLVNLLETGEITLVEITDSFKITDKLITKEHASALKTVNALKEMKIDDPVKYIQTMQAQAQADAESVRNAKLSEVFGVSALDKDGNETNLVLAYAKDKVKDSAGDELVAAIEELKSDPIAVRLQADKADPNSQANNLGIIDGKSKDGQPAKKSGPKSVIL